MDASDYGQLDSIMSAVEVEGEEVSESAEVSPGNTGFQEKLRLHFQVAQQNLSKDLTTALEMLSGQLTNTRLLEDELSKLRKEKRQLAMELAALHINNFDGACGVPGAAAEDEFPLGSPCASDVWDVDATHKGSILSSGSIMSSGTTSCTAFSPTTQTDQEEASAARWGSRGDLLNLDSLMLISPGTTQPPPLPNAVDSIVPPGPIKKARPKSAMKDRDETSPPSRRGSHEAPDKSDIGPPGLPPLLSTQGKSGSNSMVSRRASVVSIQVQPGLVVQPGQAVAKKGVTKLGSMEELPEPRSEEEGDLRPSESSMSETGTTDAENDEFALLSVWCVASKDDGHTAAGKTGRIQRKLSEMMFDISTLDKGVMTLRDDDDDELNCFMLLLHQTFVHPSASYRVGWDITSFLFLAYDMITLPMLGAFNLDSGFITFMVWFTRLFWTCDIFASLVTGFMRMDGVVEMRPFQIWKRYARTWMLLDLILVSSDWVEMFVSLDSTIDIARVGKASRGLRILRLLRLLRLLRFLQWQRYIEERFRSERLIIVADIVKFVLMILLSAHFAACVWYGIGTSTTGRSWVSHHIDADDPFAAVSLRYAISLHWSLSQFAGGMSEFVPQNFTERLYTVILFIIAFMMAAVLVSVLTSEITRLKIISNTQSQQMSTLRRFLSDNHVSTKLAIRVQRNARTAVEEQQRNTPETSVELLQLVSEPLRVELHFEIQSPLLSKHPFFSEYIDSCPHIMRRVCHKCTKMTSYSRGDVIFNPGEIPRPAKMYFVANGFFEYFLMSGHRVRVGAGSWVSEPVIWTSWTHKGGLRAKGDSHICELLAEEFQQVCVEFDHNTFDPRTYGARFIELMNNCESVSDLPMSRDQLEEASSLSRPASLRQGSGRPGSALLSRGSGLWSRHSHAIRNSPSASNRLMFGL